jgi:hypothetical protein
LKIFLDVFITFKGYDIIKINYLKEGDFVFKFIPIKITSSSGYDVINDFYCNENKDNSLVVLFPGVNYSCEKPLLHYARKAATIEDYDVLCIRYGFKLSKKDMGKEIIKIIAKEVLQVIKNCSSKNYDNIYFISKSIGGEIAGNIANIIGYDNVRSLYLTPTPTTMEHISNSKCSVIVGTKDPIFTQENVQVIKDYDNVNLTLIDNAQHSLEVDNNLEESIESLGKVANIFIEFLSKNKAND